MTLTTSRHDWAHGLARCPACGLSLDPEKDLVRYVQFVGETPARSALARHRRCGTEFEVVFYVDTKS